LKAEDAVFELWKLDCAKAQELWEQHFTQAPKGVVPGFIHRKALQEGIDVDVRTEADRD
jgi:hypothetical protein